ncbi:MAG: DUF3556 domain-containing protein [Polyangiales bacterium]
MRLPAPKLPPYDVAEWRTKPFAERMKLVCQAWAIDGYGTPSAVYAIYLVKIALYVAAWFAFCSTSSTLGPASAVSTWWSRPEAIEKAILWSMAYEGLGLGCGSGPLTGRYFPPVGGFLYFLRPGTTKMPFVPGLPLLGGMRRTWLDVLLYLAHQGFLFRALLAPELTPSMLLPTVVLLPLLGLADKTIVLASRAEHFYTALVCFLFPLDALAALKCVWIAIWIWAATSKVNRHFPSVICVMTSNSALFRSPWLRKRMYRAYPDDLAPSALAHAMAHAGTVVEYAFPVLLATSAGGLPTTIGLVVMLGFHSYITSNIPMAVPIEWNVIMVYGAFALFGAHADVRFHAIASPLLLGFLVAALVGMPILGNFFPRFVSFLFSMRYYAGNWAYSVWLFRDESVRKLDRGLVKVAPLVDDQLRKFYDETTVTAVVSKVMAFRAMHLHGRALRELVPKAVDDIDRYVWLDGELVAGVVIGWNFGEGHLHDEQLLRAVQAQCGFEEGELRCIFVESQPFLHPQLPYRIVDAKTGELERGSVSVDSLLVGQPWAT